MMDDDYYAATSIAARAARARLTAVARARAVAGRRPSPLSTRCADSPAAQTQSESP